jgi:hypothetical protein
MTNDLKQRVTDAQVEAAWQAFAAARASTTDAMMRAALEAALSVSSSGEAIGAIDPFHQQFASAETHDIAMLVGKRWTPVYAHPSPSSVQTGVATHRHKRRGSEYTLLGYGRMQSSWWRDFLGGLPENAASVDMREVAIYRSVEDASLWVRPREEFEDGRFEALSSLSSAPQTGVAVKALEWKPARYDKDGRWFHADPIGLTYSVFLHRSGKWRAQVKAEPSAWLGDHDTCELAQAACQADYERRILSALSSAPAPSVEELRGALEWIRTIADANFEQDTKLRHRGARTLKRIADRCDQVLALARNSDAAGEGK